jgi:hypothetical protein
MKVITPMSGHPMDKKQFNRALLLLLKGMNRRSDSEGYAMLMTSIVAILVFSMLSVYLFSTKLYRSSAGAIVDSGSTFYAAESGMNRRASLAHAKFEGFSQPVGVAPPGGSVAEQMNNCISGSPISKGTEDFQCITQDYDYYEQNESATGVIDVATRNSKNGGKSKYTSYTFIQPNPANPLQRRIPTGENFAGLNMLEYNYRVYATSIRRNDLNAANGGIAAQSLLQMDFNSRVIPLFQFAAFYENDLEVNPSPDMTLNGPVHTNSNIYLAPGGNLDLQGQVTSVQDMYKSLGFKYLYGGTAQNIKLANGSIIKSAVDVYPPELMKNSEINNSGGQLRPKIDRLNVPQPGFLGTSGEYFGKADLRVQFQPNANARLVPFQVTTVPGGGGTNAVALSQDTLRSLRQPVFVSTVNDDEQRAFCNGVQVPSAAASALGLKAGEINNMQIALRTAILSQPEPVLFGSLNLPVADGGVAATNTLRTTFQNYLQLVGIKAGDIPNILTVSPRELMALNGNCFVPAPFQVTIINDRREGRNIQVLQTNIQSLTVWNRDGQQVEFDPTGLVTNHNGGRGFNVPTRLFNRAAPDNKPAKDGSASVATSLRRLGLAGSDRSEGGFVWHFDLNTTAYPYPPQQSIYGFAFSGGQDLPNSLTIATEQAIYIQGDYNSVDWKSAATMGDTIAVLSNACSDNNRRIVCGNLRDGTGNFVANQNAGTDLAVATPTTVRAAFLSNTDLTDTTQSPVRYSGGLNNYIRMLENWQDVPLTYRGSFISLGTAAEFSGRYQAGKLGWGDLRNINNLNDYYYYYPPIRNYFYDTNFNFAERLPPLTPQVVFLQQKVFKRDYDSNR